MLKNYEREIRQTLLLTSSLLLISGSTLLPSEDKIYSFLLSDAIIIVYMSGDNPTKKLQKEPNSALLLKANL